MRGKALGALKQRKFLKENKEYYDIGWVSFDNRKNTATAMPVISQKHTESCKE